MIVLLAIPFSLADPAECDQHGADVSSLRVQGQLQFAHTEGAKAGEFRQGGEPCLQPHFEWRGLRFTDCGRELLFKLADKGTAHH